MNIHHLEYFLEVIRQGSFSKAATALHITQPSISKMILNLESELGVVLINRNTKTPELTDAGKAIFGQAQQIVALFHNLTDDLYDVIHLKKGIVRIGIPPIASSTVFPPILGKFNKCYPHIELHLTEFGSKKIEAGVHDGSLDVGIVCTIPEKIDNLEVFTCIRDPLRVIVHTQHPLAKEAIIDFAALANESFVLYNEDFSLYDHILDRCKLAGFKPKIICTTAQREFMTQMVAANLGIALLPGKICDELDAKSIVSIPFTDPQIILQLSIIRGKDRYLSFAARHWLEFCRQTFQSS